MSDSVNIIPGDEPKSFCVGWVIYEEVGIAVINNFSANIINCMVAETDEQRRLRLLRKMLRRNNNE